MEALAKLIAKHDTRDAREEEGAGRSPARDVFLCVCAFVRFLLTKQN